MLKRDRISVRRARPADLSALVTLFEGYRAFYGLAPRKAAAARFLSVRLRKRDSLIWVATTAETLVGFTQVFPIFSSLRTKRAWLLNDLFVAHDFRSRGVGRALLKGVANAARQQGIAYVELATQHTNRKAQRLYAAEGYQRDREFQHWSLSIAP